MPEQAAHNAPLPKDAKFLHEHPLQQFTWESPSGWRWRARRARFAVTDAVGRLRCRLFGHDVRSEDLHDDRVVVWCRRCEWEEFRAR